MRNYDGYYCQRLHASSMAQNYLSTSLDRLDSSCNPATTLVTLLESAIWKTSTANLLLFLVETTRAGFGHRTLNRNLLLTAQIAHQRLNQSNVLTHYYTRTRHPTARLAPRTVRSSRHILRFACRDASNILFERRLIYSLR